MLCEDASNDYKIDNFLEKLIVTNMSLLCTSNINMCTNTKDLLLGISRPNFGNTRRRNKLVRANRLLELDHFDFTRKYISNCNYHQPVDFVCSSWLFLDIWPLHRFLCIVVRLELQ